VQHDETNFTIQLFENENCWGWFAKRGIFTGLNIVIRFVQLSAMKNLLYTLRDRADSIFQNNIATKGRPLGFQIAVATIFAIDVVAFITFCIIKIVSQ
jgi:hypothetical protein